MIGLSIPGDVVIQANAYMLDKTNGANLITISLGHSLDMLNYVLGEFAALSAMSDLRRPMITIEETGEQTVKTAADQIALVSTTTSRAAAVHIREAVARRHLVPVGNQRHPRERCGLLLRLQSPKSFP